MDVVLLIYLRAALSLSYCEALLAIYPQIFLSLTTSDKDLISLGSQSLNHGLKKMTQKSGKAHAGKFFMLLNQHIHTDKYLTPSLVLRSKIEICPMDQNHLKEPDCYCVI